MADCASLPNVPELIALLREDAKWCSALECAMNIPSDAERNIRLAADMIEQLSGKAEHLKEELDAALSDLRYLASYSICKHSSEDGTMCNASNPCFYGYADSWEWRGVPDADHFRDVPKMIDEEPCEACSLDGLLEQINGKKGADESR